MRVADRLLMLTAIAVMLAYSACAQVQRPEDPAPFGAAGQVNIQVTPSWLSPGWELLTPGAAVVSGSRDTTLAAVPAGTYSLTWHSVPGFTGPRPSSTSRSLLPGGAIVFSGTFESQSNPAAPWGTLRIEPSPALLDASWTLVGPSGSPINGAGLAVIADQEAGSYTITWRDLPGWITPTPSQQTSTLEPDQTLTFFATYVPVTSQTATVVIDPSPASIAPPWTISGPGGFSGSGSGDRTFANRAPGTYTLTWDDVSGWTTPTPRQVTQVLAQGGTIRFQAAYGNPFAPSIQSVAGTVAHGRSVELRGQSFGSHTLDVEWTGSWIEAQPVGTNPDTKAGWSHYYSSHGLTDHISTARAWSGTKSIDASVDTEARSSWQSTLSYRHAPFTKLYVSYWMWTELLQFQPGGNDPERVMAKHNIVHCDCQMGCNNGVQTTYYISKASRQVSQFEWYGWAWLECPGLSAPTHDVWDDAYGVGYTLGSPGWDRVQIQRGELRYDPRYGPQMGKWTRMDFYYDAGIADQPTGELFARAVQPGSSQAVGTWAENVVNLTARTNCSCPPEPWERFTFTLFVGDGNPILKSAQFLDDVYLQFGTRARVELGDRPVYDECTVLEIQRPTDWSDSSVSIELNRGRFLAGSTAYLFVVREDEVASAGMPVVLQ